MDSSGSIIFQFDIINLIIKNKISKFIKKAPVRLCKLCKGNGCFKGLGVDCKKCNKSGYTGLRLKVGSIYECKLNKKHSCFYARIKIVGVGVVDPINILENNSFCDYGFQSKKDLKKFLGKGLDTQVWVVDFKVVSVTDVDSLTEMQKYDNRRSIDEGLKWM